VKGVILGYIFSELSKNILLIISLKKRGIPFIQLYFSLNRLKPFIKFSILVFSKQLFNFFARKADEIIIGGYFAPEILGDYFFAKDSILKIVQLINQAITRVFFPLFSKIKNQIQQVKKYYFYLIRYMSLIAFPILMGLILVADPLIPIIFGEKWDNTIYLFQLLAIPAFFTIITANNATAVLYALNKPSLVLKIEVYINIVYFILLFIVVKYGFIYLVITTIVKMISKAILLQFLCGKKIYMTFLNYMSSLRYTLLSTSIMVIIVLSLSNLLKEYHIDGILNLSLLILSGGTTYLLSAYFIFPKIKTELIELIKKS
jgi:O-antigen/teichoic acid export membrane protein